MYSSFFIQSLSLAFLRLAVLAISAFSDKLHLRVSTAPCMSSPLSGGNMLIDAPGAASLPLADGSMRSGGLLE